MSKNENLPLNVENPWALILTLFALVLSDNLPDDKEKFRANMHDDMAKKYAEKGCKYNDEARKENDKLLDLLYLKNESTRKFVDEFANELNTENNYGIG